jgi:hypothetical protein
MGFFFQLSQTMLSMMSEVDLKVLYGFEHLFERHQIKLNIIDDQYFGRFFKKLLKLYNLGLKGLLYFESIGGLI